MDTCRDNRFEIIEKAKQDLEEAAKEYSFNIPTQLEADSVWKKETEQHFKDGAKYHEDKMKEALQAEYEKGLFDMREEMMKDAISCSVDWYDGFILNYTQEQQDDILLKLKAKVGDKVKIIIVKED